MGFISLEVQAWVAALASLMVQSFYLVLLFFMFSLKTNLPSPKMSETKELKNLPASPAETGYLYHADYHDSCLVATLVHLAIEGVTSISDHYQGWLIQMEAPCPSSRTSEERLLFQEMFKNQKTFLVEREKPNAFIKLNESFQAFLDKIYGKKLTRPHLEGVLGSAVLAVFGGFLTWNANNCSGTLITTYSAVSFILVCMGTQILRKPTPYLFQGYEMTSRIRSKIMKGPDSAKGTDEILEDYFLYLPHAISLEAGRFWTIATAELLKSRGVDPTTIEPDWYSGGSRGLMDIISLIDGLLGCLKAK